MVLGSPCAPVPAIAPARFGPSAFALTMALAISLLAGCASTPTPQRAATSSATATTKFPNAAVPSDHTRRTALRAGAVETARSLLGTRYRYGGRSPERGFDCSGLIVYSYQRAGLRGLPHSARSLAHRAKPVPLDEIEPGDLLFFRLSGSKISHVALYEGDRHFIHAPSSGKTVERIGFDHTYWGPRLEHAGRID